MTQALASVKRDWVCFCQTKNLMGLHAALVGGAAMAQSVVLEPLGSVLDEINGKYVGHDVYDEWPGTT
jgi:hypothetical protein